MRSTLCAVALSLLVAACGDNIKPGDGDTGFLVITPATGLETDEAGTTATFTVSLIGEPRDSITVDLTSSNALEGVVSPETITFTSANWNRPTEVTVTGVNDRVDDGDQLYLVHVDAHGFGEADVGLANRDNDESGVAVTPTAGLVTSESGTTATFTVVLTSEPSADVTIPLSTSALTEGSVSPASLTFTPQNWNAERTVTVTGEDDPIADDDQPFTVELGTISSTDAKYAAVDASDVALTNLDNDTANFLVTPTTGLSTTESQGTAKFTVRLLTQPTAPVTIDVASNTPGEGIASPATLTFTTLNWNAPQEVTVTGVDDLVADGAVAYMIALDNVVTTDAKYATRNPADVSLENLDNDSAGVQVSLLTTAQTSEAGDTAQFEVVLLSQPLGIVTIPVSSFVPAEGTTPTTELVFTTLDWNAPQTVTVTGVDDAVDDGDQQYAIVLGADQGYLDSDGNPVDPADVSLVNLDNDGAGFLVSRNEGLITEENGASDTFTIKLLSQPTADVVVSFVSSDTTEATVSPASPITFTAADWDQEQTISLVGQDDLIKDGDQPVTVTLTVASADATYDMFSLDPVQALNKDDDIAAIRVTPLRLDVSEFGDSETFEIVLTTEPTADVVIGLSVSDPDIDNPEFAIDTSTVTFTTINWATPQVIEVTGLNDALIDGQQQFFVRTAPAVSADLAYNTVDAADVLVVNFDDESPGVYVQGHNLLKTLEGSNQPQFVRMRLTIAPLFPVTCTVRSTDETEVSIEPSVFTFDATNFSQLQTITVRGVDDLLADGDQEAVIFTEPCTSADPLYNLFDPRNIRVLNRDNE